MKTGSPARMASVFMISCFFGMMMLHGGEGENKASDMESNDLTNKGIQFSCFVQPIAYMGITDEHDAYDNRITVRRARLDARVRLGNFVNARIQGDLASPAVLVDAYADLRISDLAAFRMGRFKSPLSLERAQSVSSLLFNDFAYTASVALNRDIGIAFHGTFFHRFLDLQVAYVNGAGNGGSSSGDIDDTKDGVVHVGISPFVSALEKKRISLLLAAGASAGERCGEALHSLKTPAGTELFHYRPSVRSRGKTYRLSPQFRFISPHFFLLGEYVLADYGIADTSGHSLRVLDRAWTLSAGYMIGGGARGVKGMMINEDAVISRGGKGAFEFVGRIHGFHADPEPFDVFVSSAHSVGRVVSLETGLNWYYADNSCVRLVYARSVFERGALSGDRKPENTVLLSVNLAV